MNKHSVALILTYSGKFPNYFPLWLKSAGANPDFTFMVFTDSDTSGYKIPANVQIHQMTLEEFRQRASKHLGFEAVMPTPYKRCEYQPMYGLIFEDYLAGYDFWGHVDADIVWGNIGKFVTDSLLDDYNRLFRLGHCVIYRNTDEINHFFLHELPGWNISYKDAYRVSQVLGMSENALTDHLFTNFTDGGGGMQYDRVVFADLLPHVKNFRCVIYRKLEDVAAFRWTDGKLYGLAVGGDPEREKEYMYVHLQKRPMILPAEIEHEDSFLIVPNEFVKDHTLTQEEIHAFMTPDPDYGKSFVAKHRIGEKRSLFARVSGFLAKNRAEKILRLKTFWNKLLGRRLYSRY